MLLTDHIYHGPLKTMTRHSTYRSHRRGLPSSVLDKEADHAINESQMYAFTIDHCYNANVFDVPQSYSEAISSSDASKWDLAMKNLFFAWKMLSLKNENAW